MSKCFVDSEKKTVPLTGRTSLAVPVSGRGGHVPQLVGGQGRKTGQRHIVKERVRY